MSEGRPSEGRPSEGRPSEVRPSEVRPREAPEPGATAPEPPPVTPHRRDAFGLERLVLFSDAVFAIAITLLALNLRVPERPGGYTDATLLGALGDLGPSLFAFLLSFAVTATFWLGHFRTFRLLDRIDGRLITLNMVFLCWVVLLPFPTSVVATQGNLPSGTVLYAVFVTAGGLLSALLWIYPTQVAKLASPRVTPELAQKIAIRALVAPAIFAVTIPVALVSPYGAEVGWVLAPVAQALVRRHYGLGEALERSVGSLEGETTGGPAVRQDPPEAGKVGG